ncbi:hypothetical protein niasHS_001481 [Heterodera schachtii]|uniref:Uncharacterized protein n=1 Tax=Heterodera schachtii TaxID=97005 RepID=A0ABD2I8A9_HETSC
MPSRQFSRLNTRLFKEIVKRENKEPIPRIIPTASTESSGFELSDPSEAGVLQKMAGVPKMPNFELPPVEEYYVIDQEEVGVVVPMVAEKEPYLRDDLIKRPLELLTVDELVDVLRDQRARNITVIQLSDDESNNSKPFVIICSPFNARHGKALMIILRAFLKRNFIIKNHQVEVPERHAVPPRWNVLNMAGTIVHILDEELRLRYDLESLFLGLDCDEEGNSNAASWQVEFRLPASKLIKMPSQLGLVS